jgi:hypothetical protein
MKPCANSCLGEEDCRRVDCCHNCRLYAHASCTNDGAYGFVPRYFVRLATG